MAMIMLCSVVLTGTGVSVKAEEKNEESGAVFIQLKSAQEESLAAGEKHVVAVSAQSSLSTDATLNLYLKNNDDTAALDVAVPNLYSAAEEITDAETQKTMEETLAQAVCYADGTTGALNAVWMQDTDSEGNVTARYLQATVPAGAAVNFDVELQYNLDADACGIYEKIVKVEASAQAGNVDVTDVTETDANKENVSWAGEAITTETLEDTARVVAASAAEVVLYFAVPENWNNYTTIYANAKLQSEKNNWRKLTMTDTGSVYGENELKVYMVTISSDDCPYGGFATLQFQSYNGSTYVDQNEAFVNSWTSASDISGKLYTGSAWVDYTPFDPDDHTLFGDKTINFENRGTADVSGGVTAVFYEKDSSGTLTEVSRVAMTKVNSSDKKFSVTIPTAACSYVQFVDANGNILGDTYSNFYGQGVGETGVESFVYNASTMYCYRYYSNASNSTWGTLGGTTVYFDATLSKLSYEGTATNNSLPSSGVVSCHVWSSAYTSANEDLKMTKISTHTEGENTWTDVYQVDVPDKYDRILFYDGTSIPGDDAKAKKTVDLEIPTNLANPCFYADSSDSCIYDNALRSGYWDEVYSIRDAESGKNTDVVDIKSSAFTKSSDVLYVNSTFYDYYSDYELNGYNRDSYGGENGASQRNWVTFRQFDQALSDYYKSENVSIPIYTGHFQPNWSDWENLFSAISDTLGLYGYDKDNQNSFMSTNNSTMDINGNGGKYDYAAQRLVTSSLVDGVPQMKTSGSSTVSEPHFDEDFLTGNNSKNTVLADVYHNVAFPFTKKDRDGNGVDYWCFDSAETTLAMRKDSNGTGYYLYNTGNQDWSKNVDSTGYVSGDDKISNTYGFFPFNEGTTKTSGKNYNYGLGTKLEFTFRLTNDGTVLDRNGNKVDITFAFSGDDDVWVYIDGELALDVGGAHGRVDGVLDFKTMKATVSNVKASAGDSTAGSPKTTDFTIKNDRTDEHTLTMFYMERGMWESNMKVSFNFPDENKLWVEKELKVPEVNSLFDKAVSELSSENFEFDIRNLATHEKEKAAASNAATLSDYNAALTSGISKVTTSTSTSGATSAISSKVSELTSTTKDGKSVVRWKADGYRSASAVQSQTDNRLISIAPTTDTGIFDASDASEYLTFEIYNEYDGGNGENGSSPFVALVDSSRHIIGAWAGDVGYKGTKNRSGSQTWNTISVDLAELKENSVYGTTNSASFDFSSITEIRIGYWNCSHMNISNIEFHKSATITTLTGFVTKQKDIPSYGSVSKGTLQPANGAQYTLKTEGSDTASKEVIDNGTLYLRSGQTATFYDQFRRGSYLYIAEKNVDPEVFDTSWTVYDNYSQVASSDLTKTTTYVKPKSGSEITTVTAVKSFVADDGRLETTTDSPVTVPEKSILFRSYSDPDNTTASINLGVKFVNTLKTGNLKITKAQVGNVFSDTDTFHFKVTFTNVAAMGLEGSTPIEYEFDLKVGESEVISNIPAGTNYVIEEIIPEDSDISIAKVGINGLNDSIEARYDKSVTGIIFADAEGEYDCVTFTNTKNPTITIEGEKKWEDINGNELVENLPNIVILKLQRKVAGADDSTYEDVPDLDDDGNEKAGTVRKIVLNADTNWAFTVANLAKYAGYNKETGEYTGVYEYRLVELSIDGEDVVDGSGAGYKVSYEIDEDGKYIVTNTYLPSTDLKITKVDAADTTKKLSGVEFRLDKQKGDGQWTEVSTKTTGDGNNSTTLGVAIFSDLEDGTYQLTETKTQSGYSLLKDPIIIVIDHTGKTTVDDKEYTISNDTIELTISNRALFELPSTGGYGREIMILGGLVLAWAILFKYRLQICRKGGKKSRKCA